MCILRSLTSCQMPQLVRFYAGNLNAGSALSGGRLLSHALSQWPVRPTCCWVPLHWQGAFSHGQMATCSYASSARTLSVMSCRSVVSCRLVPSWGTFWQHLAYALPSLVLSLTPCHTHSCI